MYTGHTLYKPISIYSLGMDHSCTRSNLLGTSQPPLRSTVLDSGPRIKNPAFWEFESCYSDSSLPVFALTDININTSTRPALKVFKWGFGGAITKITDAPKHPPFRYKAPNIVGIC
ncbi:hypothetical protein K435DRAFT_849659 [Dendrothele bispora CBS 962.96]|uniref:Uncharacterized protein n=1 Tax=Dendrothele bispora (strain CBS 962.96) TaxID=1314807 RepID=A0A4S8MRU1_DENBC|nr:hypothetical protein K435DRAFT_849659 [Dendrothele bispora CBS 962.96]